MHIIIKTLIAISARGIEINFVFTLLKTTSIAVENLIPSSGRVHLICSRPCNLITLYSFPLLELSFYADQLLPIHSIEYKLTCLKPVQSTVLLVKVDVYPCGIVLEVSKQFVHAQ